MPKTLYTETLGPATVSLEQYGHEWAVFLSDTSANVQREMRYRSYEEAIVVYDDTCRYAAKRYVVERPLPGRPNFAKAALAP